jgi:hypothetical protein
MAELDLDALRAARSEAENEPHTVTLNGRAWRLVPRMPLEFVDLLAAGQLGNAMKTLLVDPADWDEFKRAVPDDQDLFAIASLYGVDLGESQGSPATSGNGGPPSKPTSKSTITSTSRPRATARKPSGPGGSTA